MPSDVLTDDAWKAIYLSGWLLNRVKYYNYILLVSVFLFVSLYGINDSTKQEDNSRSDQIDEGHDGYPEVWIEVHDLSPGYGYGMVEEILDVIERYPESHSKVVLFVIPNHGDVTALNKYPDYVKKLKTLEDAGYIIGLHGYRHFGDDNIYEFNTSKENADILLSKAREEFIKSNMSFPEYFAPPGWTTSTEASVYLNEQFDYVYYADHIATQKGSLDYTSHEYTWYTPNATSSFKNATADFLGYKEDAFRLTLHLNAVNNKDDLKFLNDFLKWIEETKNEN